MLHLVHHPDYVTPQPPGAFPADKYGLLIPALEEAGVAFTRHLPEPMPRAWIEAVHDPDYVAAVFEARVPPAVERRIGFPVTERIARRVRLTPGGTWAAARLALVHGYAANGAGGSHHALHDTGAGYCVFNDLAVAAHRLIEERTVARILIVDLDVHQGDGTGDAAYLDALAATLPALVDAVAPQLILYQSGVDPHADDRLGRLSLSDDGLAARDRFVAAEACRVGAPVASALGGGYGPDRMALARRHAASMAVMADAMADRPMWTTCTTGGTRGPSPA